MPLLPYCDNCLKRAPKNAASSGLTSKRGDLVVHTKVMKSSGAETPIICEQCVQLAVQHGAQGEAA